MNSLRTHRGEFTWEQLHHVFVEEGHDFQENYGAYLPLLAERLDESAIVAALRRMVTWLLRPADIEDNTAVGATQFHDLFRLYEDQWSKNRRLTTEILPFTKPQDLAPVLPAARNWLPRAFNQLPCTRFTVDFRVELIRQYAKVDDAILLLGDDDGVGVALVNAGYRDITVLDIDDSLLRRIQVASSGAIQCHPHDLTQPAPPALKRSYAVVLMDPPCSFMGVRLFLKGAQSLVTNHDECKFILVTNILSQCSPGMRQMESLFREDGLSMERFDYGSSVYALPLVNRVTMSLVIFAVALVARQPTWLANRHLKLRYFVSDTYVLTQNGKLRRNLQHG